MGKEGVVVGIGLVDPGKRHFLYLARVGMGMAAPGKREILGFARVGMG